MLTLESVKEASLPSATRLALVVEYDGARFFGFQLQAKEPTIQGELEAALKKLTGEDIRVHGACRTDTGVHARGQVITFLTNSALPVRSFVNGMNYYLPEDIAIKSAYAMPEDFSVRHASRREYRYFIFIGPARSAFERRYAHHVIQPLDVAAMDSASQSLVGEHDFIAFVTSLDAGVSSTVRRVYEAGVSRKHAMVVFKVVANAFLPHQVRNTVGALIRVGLGKMSIAEFKGLLEARAPALAGPTAPAHGLFLIQVTYTRPLTEFSI